MNCVLKILRILIIKKKKTKNNDLERFTVSYHVIFAAPKYYETKRRIRCIYSIIQKKKDVYIAFQKSDSKPKSYSYSNMIHIPFFNLV